MGYTTSSFNDLEISQCLHNEDKDLRYMALSDIVSFVSRPAFEGLTEPVQARMCSKVLDRLSDSSSEVQGMAVKALAALIHASAHAMYIESLSQALTRLCDSLLAPSSSSSSTSHGSTNSTDTAKIRDVTGICLKTIIAGLENHVQHSRAQDCCSKILNGIEQNGDVELKLLCMDVLYEIIRSRPEGSAPLSASVALRCRQILLTQLSNPDRSIVRKKAQSCLASLLSHGDERDVHVVPILEALMKNIQPASSDGSSVVLRSSLQCLTGIVDTVGFYLRQESDRLVDMLLGLLGTGTDGAGSQDVDADSSFGSDIDSDDGMADERCEEMETAIQTLEALVKAHHIVGLSKSQVHRIAERIRGSIAYDPNYLYVDENDDECDLLSGGGSVPPSSDNMDTEDGGSSDDEADDSASDSYCGRSDEDYSDDEDQSWRVRKAAASCLSTLISSTALLDEGRHLNELCSLLCEFLCSRFKEREENVLVHVLDTFRVLLDAVLAVKSSTLSGEYPPCQVVHSTATRVVNRLLRLIPDASTKKPPSTAVVVAALRNLRFVAMVYSEQTFWEGCASALVHRCMSILTSGAATDDHSRLEALYFLSVLMPVLRSSAALEQNWMNALHTNLLGIIEKGCGASITADKVRLGAMRILDIVSAFHMERSAAECIPMMHAHYQLVLALSEKQGTDQSLREKSLTSLAQLVVKMEKKSQEESAVAQNVTELVERVREEVVSRVIPLYNDRLRNELSRLSAVRSLTALFAHGWSGSHIATASVGTLTLLTDLLRQQSRQLRIAVLTSIPNIIRTICQDDLGQRNPFASQVTDMLRTILDTSVSVDDLTITEKALQCLAGVIGTIPKSFAIATLQSSVLPVVCHLMSSTPVMSNNSLLLSLLSLFAAIGHDIISPDVVMDILSQNASTSTDRSTDGQSWHVLEASGRCIGSLLRGDNGLAASTVERVSRLISGGGSDSQRALAVYTCAAVDFNMTVPEGSDLFSRVYVPLLGDQSPEISRSGITAIGLAMAARNWLADDRLEWFEKAVGQQNARVYELLQCLRTALEATVGVDESRQRMSDSTSQRVCQILSALTTTERAHVDQAADETDTAEQHSHQMSLSDCWCLLWRIAPAEVSATWSGLLSAHTGGQETAASVQVVLHAIAQTIARAGSHAAGHRMPSAELIASGCLFIEDQQNVEVRRSAIALIHAVAQHATDAIVRSPMWPRIVAGLMSETTFRPELFRKINMGPFVEKRDDGLDNRKAAFECLLRCAHGVQSATVGTGTAVHSAVMSTGGLEWEPATGGLENAVDESRLRGSTPRVVIDVSDHMPVPEFWQCVQRGLTDISFDVQILTHVLLQRALDNRALGLDLQAMLSVGSEVDELKAWSTALQACLETKMKKSMSQQERTQVESAKRSVLQLLFHIVCLCPRLSAVSGTQWRSLEKDSAEHVAGTLAALSEPTTLDSLWRDVVFKDELLRKMAVEESVKLASASEVVVE